MNTNLITSLPIDIQKLTGRYRKENRFLFWFIDKYFILPNNETESIENINKFNNTLKFNKMKSKLIVRDEEFENEDGILVIETKMYFQPNYSDIIDNDINSQFISLILPILFNDGDMDNDLYNEQLSEINERLRYYEIPLQIVGAFWENQRQLKPEQFYLIEINKSIKLNVR